MNHKQIAILHSARIALAATDGKSFFEIHMQTKAIRYIWQWNFEIHYRKPTTDKSVWMWKIIQLCVHPLTHTIASLSTNNQHKHTYTQANTSANERSSKPTTTNPHPLRLTFILNGIHCAVMMILAPTLASVYTRTPHSIQKLTPNITTNNKNEKRFARGAAQKRDGNSEKAFHWHVFFPPAKPYDSHSEIHSQQHRISGAHNSVLQQPRIYSDEFPAFVMFCYLVRSAHFPPFIVVLIIINIVVFAVFNLDAVAVYLIFHLAILLLCLGTHTDIQQLAKNSNDLYLISETKQQELSLFFFLSPLCLNHSPRTIIPFFF